MWFCFGILTLIASTFWSLKLRLATNWSGVPERIDGAIFSTRERRDKDRRLVFATEIQTRDLLFDQTLYVESDARAVAILLKRNAQLRSALIEIFAYANTAACAKRPYAVRASGSGWNSRPKMKRICWMSKRISRLC